MIIANLFQKLRTEFSLFQSAFAQRGCLSLIFKDFVGLPIKAPVAPVVPVSLSIQGDCILPFSCHDRLMSLTSLLLSKFLHLHVGKAFFFVSCMAPINASVSADTIFPLSESIILHAFVRVQQSH